MRYKYKVSISLYYPLIHTRIYPFKGILGPANVSTASNALSCDSLHSLFNCLCDICIFICMVGRPAGVLWQIKSQVSFFHRIGCQTPPFPPQSTISRKHLLCYSVSGSTPEARVKIPTGSTWSSKTSLPFISLHLGSFPFSGYPIGTPP